MIVGTYKVKHLLAITIALLPSAVIAEQFTPQQMLEVMTKTPENRGVRVHDYRTLSCIGARSLIEINGKSQLPAWCTGRP